MCILRLQINTGGEDETSKLRIEMSSTEVCSRCSLENDGGLNGGDDYMAMTGDASFEPLVI